MCYENIVAEYKSTSKQLPQAQKELQDIYGKINSSNEELENINKKKQLANQGFKTHMDQIGVDMHKLKMVEALALALKEAAVPDQELPDYIQRQQQLSKAGIALGTFMAILEKFKVATAPDGGKELLELISKYGDLSQTAKGLQAKIDALSKQADGLEERAKLKGKIESDIAKLKAEKASLEAYVATLYDQKNELEHIKSEVSSLGEKKSLLLQEVNDMEVQKNSLADGIKTEEKQISDLNEQKGKYQELLQDHAKLEEKVKNEKNNWDVFQGFLGLVQSSSLAGLQKSCETLPKLLEVVQEGTYSPEFLKSFILKELAGPTFQVMKCKSCQVRFYVDKLSPAGVYQCPLGGFGHSIVVDKDAFALLKTTLTSSKQQTIEIQLNTSIIKSPKKNNSNV